MKKLPYYYSWQHFCYLFASIQNTELKYYISWCNFTKGQYIWSSTGWSSHIGCNRRECLLSGNPSIYRTTFRHDTSKRFILVQTIRYNIWVPYSGMQWVLKRNYIKLEGKFLNWNTSCKISGAFLNWSVNSIMYNTHLNHHACHCHRALNFERDQEV